MAIAREVLEFFDMERDYSSGSGVVNIFLVSREVDRLFGEDILLSLIADYDWYREEEEVSAPDGTWWEPVREEYELKPVEEIYIDDKSATSIAEVERILSSPEYDRKLSDEQKSNLLKLANFWFEFAKKPSKYQRFLDDLADAFYEEHDYFSESESPEEVDFDLPPDLEKELYRLAGIK